MEISLFRDMKMASQQRIERFQLSKKWHTSGMKHPVTSLKGGVGVTNYTF